jgi:hypothetical protein
VELLPQPERAGRHQEPGLVNLVHLQQDGHGEDNSVRQDRADHGPPEGGDTFVTRADNVWNRSVKLRNAPTKAAAKKAASDLVNLSPL